MAHWQRPAREALSTASSPSPNPNPNPRTLELSLISDPTPENVARIRRLILKYDMEIAALASKLPSLDDIRTEPAAFLSRQVQDSIRAAQRMVWERMVKTQRKINQIEEKKRILEEALSLVELFKSRIADFKMRT